MFSDAYVFQKCILMKNILNIFLISYSQHVEKHMENNMITWFS